MRYRCNFKKMPMARGCYFIPLETGCGWIPPTEFCILLEVIGEMSLMEFEEGSKVLLSEEYLSKYFILQKGEI